MLFISIFISICPTQVRWMKSGNKSVFYLWVTAFFSYVCKSKTQCLQLQAHKKKSRTWSDCLIFSGKWKAWLQDINLLPEKNNFTKWPKEWDPWHVEAHVPATPVPPVLVADLLSNTKSRRPTHSASASWSFAAACVVRVAPPRLLSAAVPPMGQTGLVPHTDGPLTSGKVGYHRVLRAKKACWKGLSRSLTP